MLQIFDSGASVVCLRIKKFQNQTLNLWQNRSISNEEINLGDNVFITVPPQAAAN